MNQNPPPIHSSIGQHQQTNTNNNNGTHDTVVSSPANLSRGSSSTSIRNLSSVQTPANLRSNSNIPIHNQTQRIQNNTNHLQESSNSQGLLHNANSMSTPRETEECPICFASKSEPFVTPCGHSFCFECISRHLTIRKNCPSCAAYLTRELIQPDFSSSLLSKKKRSQNAKLEAARVGRETPTTARTKRLKSDSNKASGAAASSALNDGLLSLNTEGLSATKIAELIAVLQQKQKELELGERRIQDTLLMTFLRRARRQKAEAIARLQAQHDIIEADMNTIKSKPQYKNGKDDLGESDSDDSGEENDEVLDGQKALEVSSKKKRINDHFGELEERYLMCIPPSLRTREGALDTFGDDLANFSEYSSFKCVATLKHGSRQFQESSGPGDMYSANNIVSSIEFDRDCDLIATAGVMKRIKIFELGNVLNSRVDIHYPVREIVTRAKLSCLSWNSYIRSHLISSDYEGVVTLWDTHSCQVVAEFEEHEKRAWSVDFSTVNPTMFASASDDGRIKIWSTTQLNSVTTIENRANVCCVKFNPESAFHIAFGSADHNVHYYDLRYPRDALSVFRGHSKAVSYVKFLSGTEIVSASTDSSLKLWSAQPGGGLTCTYGGHRNEKNFVGLATSSNYVSCGSEDNCVYTYYKAVSSPLIAYSFSSGNPIAGEEAEDANQFVSSVCWCPKYPSTLLAANSQGIIKVLELC
eukprot:CAMPEP_0182444748 /NCGR_PEP_ID=MMETSP1172-20130603/3103_1 /TAXON_ID=708627 /ORGANISM="Timspurckia oligopyrenoides, Strain CCMP3278" /LENGTH=698 /DNA_ID=CAMNT_0024640377 /DNA_START=196 /DNA_END=2292 /DNA_ORIENTATION=+